MRQIYLVIGLLIFLITPSLAKETSCLAQLALGADRLSISGKVVGIPDPWTVELKNGEKLKLANIYLPSIANSELKYVSLRHEWLKQKLPLGIQISYFLLPEESDRYDRKKALIFEEEQASINERLIEDGLALYAADTPQFACDTMFKAAEKRAIDESANLWSEKLQPYLMGNLKNHNFIENGHYSVRGKVLGIGIREKRHYMNFGQDWSQDFTVEMTPENSRSIFGHEEALMALKGKWVTVRGMLVQKGGPMIELQFVEQIEVHQ